MKKLVTLFSFITVLGLLLSACGGTAATQAPATQAPATSAPAATQAPEPTAATEPAGTLTIWADDTRTPILQGLADKFLADNNVKLVVEDIGKVQDIRSQAIIAIPAGKGPDIYVGVHDWLGALIASGLAAPLDLGAKKDSFVPSTLAAFTSDGKLYGVPYASENNGLFYNTDLVKTVPTTWDELLKMGSELKAAGKVKYAIAINSGPLYNALPVWTSYGGYVFGKTDSGAWNPQDVGIDSKGFIDGVAWMRKGVTDGLIPDTLDSAAASAMFENGEIPFYIDGPWDLDAIRKSGVPYAVATSFPGNGAPFSGVQGFFVNPFSKNVLLAQAFLTDYIATDAVMQQLADTGNRPSAFKSVLDKTTDPDLKAMGQAGTNAIPMPSIPEMGSVWTATDNGITLAITGKQAPDAALKDAATQIRGLISGAFKGMVNLPGTFQKAAGCGATWDPACQQSAMKKDDKGLYTLTVKIPKGDYEFKVAMDGSWTVAYGSDGTTSGPNYKFSLAADSTVTFTYHDDTHMVEVVTK